MAANEYTRIVNITPEGTAYAWDTPPNWISITQVGNTDSWKITISQNTGAQRNAVLTVRHENSSTVDSINVSQEGMSIPVVTPTPTPTVAPTPTPTATPIITPVSYIHVKESYNTPLLTSISLSDYEGGPGSASYTAAWYYNSEYGGTAVPSVVSKDSRVAVSFSYGTYSGGEHIGGMIVTSIDPGAKFPSSIMLDSLVIRRPDNNATYTISMSLVQGESDRLEFITPTPTTSGCHVADELITMADGSTKKVQDLVLGDALLSLAINGLTDEETIYRQFDVASNEYSDEYTSAIVNDIMIGSYSSYHNINNGALKITFEHPVLIKTVDNRVIFKIARDIVPSDYMLNENNQWIEVTSNQLIETNEFTTWSINVEDKDVYFANGYLVHNVMNEEVLSKEDNIGQEGPIVR